MRCAGASALIVAALWLAACGDEERRGAEPVPAGVTADTQAPGERRILTGGFEPLRADPLQDATGQVRAVITEQGTELSLNARGLDPRTAYFADLHSTGCQAQQTGHPGVLADAPELQFVSGSSGAGRDSTTTSGQLPQDVRSVVIHVQAEAGRDQEAPAIACAELSGQP